MSQTAAGAMGARTARACDSCLRRRARWYCAADDAFLCQGCDNSVHSANQLARRHERVRLKTASTSSAFKVEDGDEADGVDRDPTAPSWHRAVKRKARTPRNHKQGKVGRTWPLVPDLEERTVEEGVDVEEENQEEDLIYRVPILDPVLTEFCSSRDSLDDGLGGDGDASADETKPAVTPFAATTAEGLPGFLPPDMDTAAFALDVESLLGRGLEQESFCMDDLGLSESKAGGDSCRVSSARSNNIKVKKEEEAVVDENRAFAGMEMDPYTDTFDINFCCDSPAANERSETTDRKRKRVGLKLDYDSVINAWSTQGSPWADGERPRFDPDGCWLDNTELMMGGGWEVGMIGGCQTAAAANATIDVGREARVSRYREKRRTRLFSKKIRYEVRKLNAEKRPRMKGRFVKRAAFAATAPLRAATATPPFVF